jgi:hypothetical protein
MATNDWKDINDPGLPFFIRERMRKEREAEKQREKDVIDCDDALDKPVGPLKVDFLRWRHTDEKKFRESYDACSHGDIIELKAEAQGIHKGECIHFEVEELPSSPYETFGKIQWEKSAATDMDYTAVVKYTVDLSKVNDPSKLRFTASVRSKYAETKCPIKIAPKESRIVSMRFPLDAKYNDNGYTSGERSFGSSRNHGKRAHAGCDLYAPVGEKIYAVADGVITRYRDFYGQTYALEVDHGDFMVRYGEVQPPLNHKYKDDPPPNTVCNGFSDLKEGVKIKKGQHIAYIGQLRLDKDRNGKLVNYPKTMLHFELYNGDDKGDLTDKTNSSYKNVPQKNYQRRNDLLDPTQSLEQAEGN